MDAKSPEYLRTRHLATHLLRANWKGRRFDAREFSKWRKELGGNLPQHIAKVFAALKQAGTIVPVAGHGHTREYEWARIEDSGA
jgi:hypothetical protein